MSTIYAPASGAGRAAITIIRISGPDCRTILETMAGSCPPPRRATLRILRSGAGQMLDQAVILFMPGPASYTGEDMAELHVHGGRAVVHAVCACLNGLGACPAEPGAFTRRAFLNGKMDLLEAEGVADLIAAETDAQRHQALTLLDGRQSGSLHTWAEALRRALAWQEALIDFPDEDLPAAVEQELLDSLHALAASLRDGISESRKGARVRDGLFVAIVGPPNSGKSTLLNALAGREVAITSAVPGTTRDALEAWVTIAGHLVCLVDTAGLRETEDEIEAEGVRRARAHAARADLVIALEDAQHLPALTVTHSHIPVANKIDTAPAELGWLGISAKDGTGLPALRARLEDDVLRLTRASANPVFSHARHEAAIADALRHLDQALNAAMPELRGEELRLAMRALGRISGEVGAEDILDTVFGAFCIGK